MRDDFTRCLAWLKAEVEASQGREYAIVSLAMLRAAVAVMEEATKEEPHAGL